jgi:uncharacterized membrane protein
MCLKTCNIRKNWTLKNEKPSIGITHVLALINAVAPHVDFFFWIIGYVKKTYLTKRKINKKLNMGMNFNENIQMIKSSKDKLIVHAWLK